MPERSDWSVPWPDGSWLTWNDATESWEKQDEPPSGATQAQPKEAVTDKTEEAKQPVPTKVSSGTTVPKTPAPKTASTKTGSPPSVPRKTTAAKSSQPVPKHENTPSEAPSPRAAGPAPTEQNWSWQPVSDAAKTLTKVRSSSIPSGGGSSSSGRSSVGVRPIPPWSMIAAGAAVGVAAGYLLVNLIR
jgi:hypothetical protein